MYKEYERMKVILMGDCVCFRRKNKNSNKLKVNECWSFGHQNIIVIGDLYGSVTDRQYLINITI